LLAGREYFIDHFTAPDAHFFWCCRPATQLGVEILGFPIVTAHFKRMLERPSVKKLLAYEKELNEGFAKTAWALVEFRRHTQCRSLAITLRVTVCRFLAACRKSLSS
jgi:hypothetical protein